MSIHQQQSTRPEFNFILVVFPVLLSIQGFEKKALTAKDDEEVEKILNKALEPVDLGDQLGPAPRYIVPFGAGECVHVCVCVCSMVLYILLFHSTLGKLKFPINENTTPEDLKEMIEEASKPTQQMRGIISI